MRRDAAQVAADREKIMNYVRECLARPFRPGKVQRPKWARPGDVDALVKEGKLLREVVREWDIQKNQNPAFGGAGVVQRRRAYLKLPKEEP